jgi:CIC family chloride channel protein
VLATAIANMLTRDTIYTLKLRRRGIEIDQERSASPMRLLTVREAMQSVPVPVAQNLRLGEVIGRFAEQGRDALPVVDAAGRYRGTVTSRRVEQALREDGHVVLSDLAESIPTLRPDETLEEAVGVLVRSAGAGLPVVDPDLQEVVGWLTHHDVLRAFSEAVSRGKGQVRPRHPAPT